MEDNIKYVVCKICGAKRRILTHHLSKQHSLSRYEYEQTYNSPVVCKERQLIQIERNDNLNKMLATDPYYIKLMREVRKANCKLPQVQEALQAGADRMRATDEWKRANSEKVRLQMLNTDLQKRCTIGKLSSTKYHDQKSKQCKELLAKLWSDESWKSKQLSKMFDGSKHEYEDILGNKVHMRSYWEVCLHNYLILKGISYEYEGLKIKYISTDNKEHTYHPDFFIESMNLVLEVKPKMYINNKVNQIKRQVVTDSGYTFKFVTEDELSDLNSFFHNL